MQILTVGQSDHAKDAGETAAGGGTRPSGQDLRATMQRKGEPHGGPAGTKAQSQVLRCTLLQENSLLMFGPVLPWMSSWRGIIGVRGEVLGQGP